jgi:hypothetical protein
MTLKRSAPQLRFDHQSPMIALIIDFLSIYYGITPNRDQTGEGDLSW